MLSMEVKLRAHFRFLEKVIVELLLRRRSLYPAELRVHQCRCPPAVV